MWDPYVTARPCGSSPVPFVECGARRCFGEKPKRCTWGHRTLACTPTRGSVPGGGGGVGGPRRDAPRGEPSAVTARAWQTPESRHPLGETRVRVSCPWGGGRREGRPASASRDGAGRRPRPNPRAPAGLSAFHRDLCFRMACGRTVVPSAYGTTFVPLAWPHRCTAHPPWGPPAVGAPASAQFLFLHSKPGGATAVSMQRAHGRWLREVQTSLFKHRCFVVPSSKKCLNPSVSNCHRDGLHWRRAGSCTCLPCG